MTIKINGKETSPDVQRTLEKLNQSPDAYQVLEDQNVANVNEATRLINFHDEDWLLKEVDCRDYVIANASLPKDSQLTPDEFRVLAIAFKNAFPDSDSQHFKINPFFSKNASICNVTQTSSAEHAPSGKVTLNDVTAWIEEHYQSNKALLEDCLKSANDPKVSGNRLDEELAKYFNPLLKKRGIEGEEVERIKAYLTKRFYDAVMDPDARHQFSVSDQKILLSRSTEKYPRSVQLWSAYADLRLNHLSGDGDKEEAEFQVLLRAMDLGTTDLSLADTLIRLELYTYARLLLENALREDPQNQKIKDLYDTVKSAQAAKEKEKEEANLAMMLAHIERTRKLKGNLQASVCMEKILEKLPDIPELIKLYDDIKAELDRNENVGASVEDRPLKVIEQESDDYLLDNAQRLAFVNRHSDVINLIESKAGKEPNDPDLRFLLAEAYASVMQYLVAIDHLQYILDNHPDDPVAKQAHTLYLRLK